MSKGKDLLNFEHLDNEGQNIYVKQFRAMMVQVESYNDTAIGIVFKKGLLTSFKCIGNIVRSFLLVHLDLYIFYALQSYFSPFLPQLKNDFFLIIMKLDEYTF